MASFIKQNLLSDEMVLYTAKLSLWSVAPIITLGTLLILTGFFGGFGNLFIIGLIILIAPIIKYQSTELAFTNKRIIAKFGFVSRKTVELNINKVETILMDQTFLGRIFNFGSLIISGGGNVATPIRGIANPISFRKAFLEFHDTNAK